MWNMRLVEVGSLEKVTIQDPSILTDIILHKLCGRNFELVLFCCKSSPYRLTVSALTQFSFYWTGDYHKKLGHNSLF